MASLTQVGTKCTCGKIARSRRIQEPGKRRVFNRAGNHYKARERAGDRHDCLGDRRQPTTTTSAFVTWLFCFDFFSGSPVEPAAGVAPSRDVLYHLWRARLPLEPESADWIWKLAGFCWRSASLFRVWLFSLYYTYAVFFLTWLDDEYHLHNETHFAGRGLLSS